MNPHQFFAELKRRNVYKVAVAYGVVSWLLIQAASILLPTFEAPTWVMKAFIILLALGFIGIVFISWAFESTPEGLKRTEDVSLEEAAKLPSWSRRKFVTFIAGVALIAIGLLVYQFFGPKLPVRTVAIENEPAIQQKSIAVLPFDNLSRDPDNAYFAEGVQDEILTRLAKVADLKVISRTSTQHFKSAPDNLPQIAKQLGVMNILEGTVQKSNDQVRVNVQLINAMTDAHLWADIYDRKLTDIFSVESDIAKAIADTLQAKLTGSEMKMMTKAPTANNEAYELYLKGRFFWNKRTAADLRRSIEYFNQAIAKDPGYALAYAASAQAWLLLPAYNGGAPADCFPQAEDTAKKALTLDDSSAEAHAALGDIKSLSFDFQGALLEFQRAIQLNPNDATAHHWFGNQLLANTGQHERELAEMRRALELDPLSLVINTNFGVAYLNQGRTDEAIAQLRKTVEMDGSFYYARENLGLALEVKKEISEAVAEFQKAIALSDDPVPLAYLGHLYGTIGRKDEARKILDQLRQLRAQHYVPAYCLAVVSLGLGDRDDTVNWLEQGYRERDGFNIGEIRIDPLLSSLHGDPRFEAVAEKIVPAAQFGEKAAATK